MRRPDARASALAVLRCGAPRFRGEAGPVRCLRRAGPRSIITMSTRPAAPWCAASARPACSTLRVAGAAADAPPIDSRLVCLARETLAWHDGLADFAFAMQGPRHRRDRAQRLARSCAPPSCPRRARANGSRPLRCRRRRRDRMSARCACAARADGDSYVLDGEKTWISNGGIAQVYTVFARTGEAPGTRGISAFVVFADDPGFSIAERIEVIAPHPLATIRFENCRIPAARRLGAPAEGFKIAMRTLDIFRASVAAAAVGFARRAMDEALAHAKAREHVRRDAGRLATDPGGVRRHGDRHRRRRAADLSRRLAPRRAAAARHPRGRDGQDERDRDGAGRDRPRAADVRRPRRADRARWSNGSIARSGRCASTRARPRCRS